MRSKYLTALLLTLIISAALLPEAALAKVKRVADPVSRTVTQVHAAELTDSSIPTYTCDFTAPKKAAYTGKFIAIRKKALVARQEVFETKVFIQNTGNVPWFSADSGCAGAKVALGTDRDRDRQSVFFTDSLFWASNWLSPNRIKMDSKRVDPGATAQFSFWSQVPDKDGYFREYFTPVAEGITWLDSAAFSTDITVGTATIDPEKRDLLKYIEKSVNLLDVDLTGAKNLEVDLSRQRMWVKIGDMVIREFRISSGKASTPTPVGTTKILEKREVRVAAKAPHYIMPKWMMFRKGGFGFHSLPSLANDRGVFWREALSHIGSPRSHGCIRLLPKDAEFLYNFTDVGTTVVVHR